MTEAPRNVLFSLESGLFPLNAFWEFSSDLQPKVLEGLKMAVDILPTDDESYAARIQGPAAEMALENKYGKAADKFAKLIDPNYDPYEGVGDGNNTKTIKQREMFCKMIRLLTSAQIQRGLKNLQESVAKKI